ncbi:MAG: DUF4199 domain-containing protein [Bacteroidales bacterium]|nr:DUF4199 domain-containing protein [Bacteroidales bacterium]
MNENKSKFYHHGLIYGAYSGIVISIVLWISELVKGEISFGGLITYIVLSTGILFCQRSWSFFHVENKPTFWNITFLGVVCGFGATLISSLYLTIDLKIIHPDALNEMTKQAISKMHEMKSLSSNEIEEAKVIFETLKIPMTILSYIIYNIFISFLFSAFSAWLAKIQKK